MSWHKYSMANKHGVWVLEECFFGGHWHWAGAETRETNWWDSVCWDTGTRQDTETIMSLIRWSRAVDMDSQSLYYRDQFYPENFYRNPHQSRYSGSKIATEFIDLLPNPLERLRIIQWMGNWWKKKQLSINPVSIFFYLEYQLPLQLEPEKSLAERAITLVTNNLSVFTLSIPLVLLGKEAFQLKTTALTVLLNNSIPTSWNI